MNRVREGHEGHVYRTVWPCRNCSCCDTARWSEYHDRMFCTYCGNPRYTSVEIVAMDPCPIVRRRHDPRNVEHVIPGYHRMPDGSYERIGAAIRHDPRCAFVRRGGFHDLLTGAADCTCGALSDLPRR